MAPEQADPRLGKVSVATDVYALGAVLYELLAGEPPFPGKTGLERLQKVASEEPRATHRLRAGLPRNLENICLKCLEKEQAQRYLSAQDLAADLRRYLAGEPVHARPSEFSPASHAESGAGRGWPPLSL